MTTDRPAIRPTLTNTFAPLFMLPTMVMPHRMALRNKENVRTETGIGRAAAGAGCQVGTKLSLK